MFNWKIIEWNVKDSFKLVKKDIARLSDAVAKLSENQTKIVDEVNRLRSLNKERSELNSEMKEKLAQLDNLIGQVKDTLDNLDKKKPDNPGKTYIASNKSKKLHRPECTFAQNIKKENKIIYNSQLEAFKEGMAACSCLKNQ